MSRARDLGYSVADAEKEIERYAADAVDAIKTIAKGAAETIRLNAEGLPAVPLASADAAAIFDFETNPQESYQGIEICLAGGYGPRQQVRLSKPLEGGALRVIVTVVRIRK